MKYGTHVAQMIAGDDNVVNFFTGTEYQCEIWKSGVEAALWRCRDPNLKVRVVKMESIEIGLDKKANS
jgi:hypothetical protein